MRIEMRTCPGTERKWWVGRETRPTMRVWGQPLHLFTWIVVLASVSVLYPMETASAGQLRAGAAAVDITPGPGVSMNGVISKPGPVRGVHDRMFSRALVLEAGDTRLAIVVNDLCIVDDATFDRAKALIEKEIGLPSDRVLMSATHSHAVPRVPFGRVGPEDDEYYQWLVRKMADAVVQANRNLADAQVAWGSFDKPECVKCRRSLCKPGSVGPNPFGQTGEQVKSVAGKSNAVIKPAGPTDPQFFVLSVRHADGKPLALLGNFSVHYCGGYARGMISADYFGAYARQLQQQLDAGADHPPLVAMMSNGTSGNTGAVQGIAMGRRKPFERIDAVGAAFAKETLRLLDNLHYQVDLTLAMRQSTLELAVRRPDKQRLAWAREVLDSPPKTRFPHPWTRTYATEALALSKMPSTVTIKLQAIRIGDLAIVALPCEAFAETGLAIKKASPLRSTFVMGLANGEFGYLPPPEQHQLGGYETWPARSSNLEVRAEPKIRSEVAKLLDSLVKQDGK